MVICGVSGQIHKDVNAILANLLRHLVMTFPHRGIPMIGKLFQFLGHFVSLFHIGVTKNFHLGFVVSFEQGKNEIRAGMPVKIRRNIAHAKSSILGPVIGMRLNVLRQCFCIFLIP